MKKQWMMAVLFTLAVVATSQAALTWTGAEDGTELFAEGNWLDNTGAIPAADTINANTAVTAATGGLIEINSGTGEPAAFSGTFRTGVGNAIHIGGGKTLGSSGTSGMGQTSTFDNPLVDVNLSGASTVNLQFAVNYAFALDGGSTLRFRGGGNGPNVSTVNFLDTVSTLQFDDETYAAFTTEHASKVTSFGSALVFGSDPYVGEAGDNAIASDINGGAGVLILAWMEGSTNPPKIVSYEADNSSVLLGETVTLSWSTFFADGVSITPGIGAVAESGSTNVTVSADTIYTLTATNAYGTTNATAEVTLVTTPPVINYYTTSNTNVLSGTTVTLSWGIDHFTELYLNGSDVTDLSSTQVVVSAETTYELIASNDYGSSTGSVSVATTEIVETIINIDLTLNASTGPAGYALPGVVGVQGQFWNAVTNEDAYASVVDANGGATTVGFDVTGTIPAIGGFGSTGGASFFGSFVFLGNQTSETQSSFAISGLDDAKTYDLYFYATWAYIDAGTKFSVDGGSTWKLSDGVPSDANAPFVEGSSYVKFSGVSTDGSGGINGLWKTAIEGESAEHRGMFNALQIVEIGSADPVADLVISGPVAGGTGVVLEWTGEAGKPYGVETNSNLIITSGWNTFATGLVGDGGIISVTNTIDPDQTFYRVISE